MPSKYAFCIDKLHTMYTEPWKLEAPAFRVFGNLYFVGNQDGASWLVDTGSGLILFDANYPTADTLLVDSIWSLGFNPRNLIAIFHTHGHFDHFGATALLKGLSGAKTYLGAADADMFIKQPELSCVSDSRNAWLPLFVPDVIVQDGDEFSFGDTCIHAVACPGHSPGATSYFFNVTDGKRTLRVGLHGGAGLNTLCRDYRKAHHVDWQNDFAASIEKVLNEPVDIFLGNHTAQNHCLEKYRALQSGADNPFICKEDWKNFLKDLRERFHTMQEEEANGTDQI